LQFLSCPAGKLFKSVALDRLRSSGPLPTATLPSPMWLSKLQTGSEQILDLNPSAPLSNKIKCAIVNRHRSAMLVTFRVIKTRPGDAAQPSSHGRAGGAQRRNLGPAAHHPSPVSESGPEAGSTVVPVRQSEWRLSPGRLQPAPPPILLLLTKPIVASNHNGLPQRAAMSASPPV
jgi:hypothetical protein